MIDKTNIINQTTFYYNNVANHKIMSAIFNSGNMFKLTITEEQKKSEFIHGYALASSIAENTKFGFLLVSANDDTVSNFANFEENDKDYAYEPIQNGIFKESFGEINNPDQITRAEAEIGEQLFITPRTVEEHKNNLFIKTGAKNIAGLVIYAIQNKLINTSDIPLI